MGSRISSPFGPSLCTHHEGTVATGACSCAHVGHDGEELDEKTGYVTGTYTEEEETKKEKEEEEEEEEKEEDDEEDEELKSYWGETMMDELPDSLIGKEKESEELESSAGAGPVERTTSVIIPLPVPFEPVFFEHEARRSPERRMAVVVFRKSIANGNTISFVFWQSFLL